MTPGAWRAAVVGERGAEAQRAAMAIADDLLTRAPVDGGEPRSWQYAQAALVHAHLARRTADYAASAEHLLDRAREALAGETDLGMSLYCGIAGLGFVALEVARATGDLADLEEIDEAVADHVGRARWDGPYDLVGGLVGLGVYALERRSGTGAILGAVLRHLEEAAEVTDVGLRWATPGGHGGGPRYDLGLAHGVPGIVALMARFLDVGFEPARSRRLLEGAVGWLRAQRLVASAASAYSYTAGAGLEPVATKVAWCYGDAGVAAALLAASRALQSGELAREALDLARRAAARDPRGDAVADAALCHGALGVAHLFNRLHQATGDETLGAASRGWFDRGLALRQGGRGIGGFSFVHADGPSGGRTVDDPTFLSGAAGVALGLLAFSSDHEPTWDRLLLLSGD